MTKEDAIEYIKLWCPYDKQNEIIEALSVEPQEWISVKKHGNPKEDGLYMVTVRGGFEETENDYVTTSHYIFDRGGWSVEDVDTEVTAWMPKPSPYKGVSV